MSFLSSINESNSSSESNGASSIPSSLNSENVDDNASSLTSITIELHKAAQETIRHAKAKWELSASMPLHMKEAMLEQEFPHVCGKGKDMGGQTVDCKDCIQTLTDTEITHLRNAMHDHEKQRLMKIMEQLTHQLEAFHEVLEENEALQQEMTRTKRENEHKASTLEERFIDMKLTLAQSQSREDHTRLKTARLEIDLKQGQEENHRLQQKLDEKLDSSGGGKLSLLPHSLFGHRGEDHAKGTSSRNSFLDRFSPTTTQQKPPAPARNEALEKEPIAAGANRSHSFADPEKIRASKGSEFMHWDSNTFLSEDEEIPKKPGQMALNRSLVHPKNASMLCEIIATDPRPRGNASVTGIHAFGSLSTILSNITDGTFGTKGDPVVAEEIGNVAAEIGNFSKYLGAMSTVVSRGSHDTTLTFEPAQPQLQHALSLWGGSPQNRVTLLQMMDDPA